MIMEERNKPGRSNCSISPVGWKELEVTRKELYVAGEELEL